MRFWCILSLEEDAEHLFHIELILPYTALCEKGALHKV